LARHLGVQRFTVAAKEAVPAGKAKIRFAFAYEAGAEDTAKMDAVTN